MKRLLLVYNPYSGTRTFKNQVDSCLKIFIEAGFVPTVIAFYKNGLLDEHLDNLEDKNYYDTVVVSGGDGTINIVLNAIMRNNLKIKLAIIPSGTANDFATHLNIPKVHKLAAELVCKEKTVTCDVGKVNDNYFINVFSAGLMTNISHNVVEEFKTIFGKLAYYVKGIEQIPNFVPMPVRIENSKEIIEDEIYLFMLLNSSGAGGFDKLCSEASINDGLFDFVAIRAIQMKDVAKLFLKILRGEHLNDENIIYFSDNKIKIDLLSDEEMYKQTDIDGEKGPNFPVEVINIQGAIEVYVPWKY